MFVGVGTLVNTATVVAGSGLGLLIGHRLPERTRTVVTDALGLVTLLIAATSAAKVTSHDLTVRVGDDAPILIVLVALLVGGIAGSLLRIEDRLEGVGGWLQRRLTSERGATARHRFVEAYVSSSLVFCVGPLTILGALTEGFGGGPQQLLLKAVLDGFASVAFAASLGIGVMAAGLSVLVIQGAFTILGVLLGSFVPDAHLAALTATGGVMLAGVGLRLLNIRQIPVGDLLPALLVAPLLTQLVIAIR